MAGRHGNNGLSLVLFTSRSMPTFQMELQSYREPLGCHHNMNISQLWSSTAGMAAHLLGIPHRNAVFDGSRVLKTFGTLLKKQVWIAIQDNHFTTDVQVAFDSRVSDWVSCA